MPRKHQHFKRPDKIGSNASKITPEIIDKIVEAIKRGNYAETAAALAGIARSTFLEWLKRGAREESGPYFELNERVTIAQAEAEDKDVSVIDQHIVDGDWKAAAWRLERKNGRRWGKKETVKVESEDAKNSALEGENIHKLICDLINETDKKPSGQDSDEEE